MAYALHASLTQHAARDTIRDVRASTRAPLYGLWCECSCENR